jgi:membrane dipeptidase
MHPGRRRFLAGSGLAAAALLATPRLLRAADRPWPPYAGMLAIDGASGTDLVYLEPGDPEIAVQLAAARECGLTAALQTVAPQGRFWLNDAAFEATKANIDKWTAVIAAHPDVLLPVRTGADLERAHRERKLGKVFVFQGTEPLGEDLDRIKLFHERGVRVIQLTHNRRNLVGDGALEPGDAGLSNYGHEVVEALNAARVVVDLAHGQQRTIREGILASKAPVLISHTGCRALSDLTRNTTDEELRLLADRGGVAGMIFWPYLRRDTQPMAIDLVRHIEHAIDVCGEDHVGIGSDTPVVPYPATAEFAQQMRENIADMVRQGIFDAGRPPDLQLTIPDLNRVDRYEVLGGQLAARGHSEARIAKILGGNFARVLKDVWG